MAGAPLLVRLCPAPDPGDKAILKLQAYFQSGKRSGGGECRVRAGPQPGTYWVDFHEERDKKSVESRTNHVLEMGAKRLKIVIQPGEEDQSNSQVTAQASASYSIPASPVLPQQEQWSASGCGDTASEVLTKKIFLTVSATLNTSMFSKEQMKKITIMCPNLKRERNPATDGFEKLTGDFTDIEKAYHYFEDILAGNDTNSDFSHSESQNGLKDENYLNTEKMDDLKVMTALYEYFSHTHKKEIKELHERFGVHIRSKDNHDGTTAINFISDESPASLKAALNFFISTFQRSIGDLKQEKIPITNSYPLEETIMKLNERFSNLLVKVEGNQFLLRGPESEISDAKRFLAKESKNSQAEKNMEASSVSYKYRNGIPVDASVFKLLETILKKELENIADKFDTKIEIIDNSYDQKMLIFRPKIQTSDLSSHATESFINAFQSASAMLREKVISLKLSEDQKKTLNVLLKEKQLEDLHVELKKKEDKLILIGLPDHLYGAEKCIMNFLNIEDSTQTKNKAPLSSGLSSQEATGAVKKKFGIRQKNNLTFEGQAKAKTEEKDDDCPICMDRIKNKETLKKCKHAFCKSCIDQAMAIKQVCPVCNTVYGVMSGNQPEGTMTTRQMMISLPGYENCGTIEITYNMKGGVQTINHPNPGKPYHAIQRRAYLPDNVEGQEILMLLRRAFDQKLIFTVGQSRTTGAQNVITWNDIHHKTSMRGGPTNFGYPDPDYLQRVRSELKAKGIE
ncbi:E3 ubiquitin-protein ligase DTX3L [Empidonax traillii]|uniref:E3 ubiquitin-protein ligase DTX3L n=1 Tax=Empidonax traillii TaxID=164674 RepID=UPI000FFCEFA9|nr:E3 ubiquitin-protein ligase DTX3L [Empidonax traillii]